MRVTNAFTTVASTQFNWKVVPTAPVLSNLAVDAVDGTTHADVTLTFAVTGPTTGVTCQIDSQPVVDPCTSGHVFTDPGPGQHSVSVSATNAGGTDTQSTPSWTFV